MDTRALARFCLWLVLTLLAVVLAARTLPGVLTPGHNPHCRPIPIPRRLAPRRRQIRLRPLHRQIRLYHLRPRIHPSRLRTHPPLSRLRQLSVRS